MTASMAFRVDLASPVETDAGACTVPNTRLATADQRSQTEKGQPSRTTVDRS